MKKFIIRALSAIIIAAVVIGATLFSPISYGVLLFVIMVGCMREFYRIAEKVGATPQKVLGYIIGVLLFSLNLICTYIYIGVIDENSFFAHIWIVVLAMAFLVVTLFPLLFICEMYRKREKPMINIGATVLCLVYIVLPLMLMLNIPLFIDTTIFDKEVYTPNLLDWNPLIVLAYIFIIWANDVFAYFVGSTIGRHKLFARISPKKSWEGLFGGVVGAVIMGIIAAQMLDHNIYIWIGLAVIASVTGVYGDLIESMFKRSAGVKDSGSIMPGHGGFLDRFDALLISAPFVFLYVLIAAYIMAHC